ncbi:MAG: hypothetical protein MRZ79_19700 [Bacteroidia bacterium]|nr:hypothetical protein [Bacteroidia bacterium]
MQKLLVSISMNDLEAIEVLKDDASTAIHVSSGGNGVFLNTTKQGKSGKAQIHSPGRPLFPIGLLHGLSQSPWIPFYQAKNFIPCHKYDKDSGPQPVDFTQDKKFNFFNKRLYTSMKVYRRENDQVFIDQWIPGTTSLAPTNKKKKAGLSVLIPSSYKENS